MTRYLAAAALAAVAVAPAAHAASSSWCEGGIRIGTLCVHNPGEVVDNLTCPILEGQTVLGIKCA